MTGCSALLVRGVDLVNRRGKSVGVRLVKLTGKRRVRHPSQAPGRAAVARLVPAASRPATTSCSTSAAPTAPTWSRGTRAAARIVGFDYDLPQLAIGGPDHPGERARHGPFSPGTSRAPSRSADRTLRRRALPRRDRAPRSRGSAVLREIRRVLKDDGRLLVSGRTARTRGGARCARPGSSPIPIPTTRSSTPARSSLPSSAAAGFPAGRPGGCRWSTTPPGPASIDAVGGVSLGLVRAARAGGSGTPRSASPARAPASASWPGKAGPDAGSGLLPALGGGIRALAESGQQSRLIDGYLSPVPAARSTGSTTSAISPESLADFTDDGDAPGARAVPRPAGPVVPGRSRRPDPFSHVGRDAAGAWPCRCSR